MTLTDQLAAATHRREDAERTYRETKSALEQEYNRRCATVRQEVEALHRDALDRAYADLRTKEAAERAALVKLNEEEPRYPLGSVLVRWRGDNSYYGEKPKVLRKTGDKGIVQVYRKGDPFIGSRWSAPKVGTLVLRFLKKDGTPGKKCEFIHRDYTLVGWYPEGTDPNVKEAVDG